MCKTEHTFAYFKLKESVACDEINVSLFAGPVCCEPRHRRGVDCLSACVDAEEEHFEHYL